MNHPKLATLVATAVLLAAGTACSADPQPMSEEDKVFYFLGTQLSANLVPLSLTDAELAALERGMRDALGGKAMTLDAQVYGQKLNEVAQQRMAANSVREQGAADSTVKAHYHGTLRDGSVFDSSVDRGEPFTSSLARVIPCWREAIPTIKEGGKSKITCPAEVAYGERGSGAIPGGAALTFEVELIEVVE
jgi:hypothetical protein